MTTQSLNLSEWPFWAPLALTAIAVVLFALARYWSRAWAVLFGLTITGVLAGTVWASLNGLWLPESGALLARGLRSVARAMVPSPVVLRVRNARRFSVRVISSRRGKFKRSIMGRADYLVIVSLRFSSTLATATPWPR